jgi:hypothetical protein
MPFDKIKTTEAANKFRDFCGYFFSRFYIEIADFPHRGLDKLFWT